MADAIARVKAENPLPDLIGRHMPLQRYGRHLVSRCPFHGEKTPSFYVYPDHFYCFGCGAHGDAIGFVMRMQRVPFAAAVAMLDGRAIAGPSTPPTDASARRTGGRQAAEPGHRKAHLDRGPGPHWNGG